MNGENQQNFKQNQNRMPKAMKMIFIWFIFVIFMSIISIIRSPFPFRSSAFSGALEILMILGSFLSPIAAIFSILAITFKKWRSSILLLLSLYIFFYLISSIAIISLPTDKLITFLHYQPKSNISIQQLERAVLIAKIILSGFMSVGLIIPTLIWRYIFNHKEYFKVSNNK